MGVEVEVEGLRFLEGLRVEVDGLILDVVEEGEGLIEKDLKLFGAVVDVFIISFSFLGFLLLE